MQFLHVVAVLAEIGGQGVEQPARCSAGWWPAGRRPVRRCRGPSVGPDAIDDDPGEIRVARDGHPLGQHFTRVAVRQEFPVGLPSSGRGCNTLPVTGCLTCPDAGV